MRRIGLIIVILVSAFLSANSQNFDYEYFLFYGNRDGSAIDVYLDSDITIEVWAGSPDSIMLDPDCECFGFDPDSIDFMHNPLASNDSIIVSRSGGAIFYPLDQWDSVSFLPPDTGHTPGYTNQSILAICYLSGDMNPPIVFVQDTILIAEFFMHTTSDSTYLNQSVCPFMEGYNPAYRYLLWGERDGMTPIIPIQTFSCLYFVDYLAGDANGSGSVNAMDAVYLMAYLNGDGPSPDPIYAGDANGDCGTDLMDVSYIINYCEGGRAPLLGNCHKEMKK